MLRRHLATGFEDPLPPIMLDAALQALEKAKAGRLDEDIYMPNGALVPAQEVFDQLRLAAFLEDEVH